MPGAVTAMPKLGRLKAIRESKYLSQRMLARSNVSRPTIARLELGEEARYETLHKLAAALGVEPGELVGEHKSGRLS